MKPKKLELGEHYEEPEEIDGEEDEVMETSLQPSESLEIVNMKKGITLRTSSGTECPHLLKEVLKDILQDPVFKEFLGNGGSG